MILPKDRLRELRLQAGFAKIKHATDYFGAHYQNWRDHEAGRIKIKPEQAKRYARWLKSNPTFILFGVNPVPGDATVGIVDFVQAGKLATVADPYEKGDWGSTVDYPYPENKLALRVVGTSMNRVSPEGSIIVIDCTIRELLPNKLYVVKVGDENEATYKRFKSNPDRLEPDSTEAHDTIFLGDLPVYPVGQVVRTLMDFG